MTVSPRVAPPLGEPPDNAPIETAPLMVRRRTLSGVARDSLTGRWWVAASAISTTTGSQGLQPATRLPASPRPLAHRVRALGLGAP
jgi:hypothetical protein